jgi:uncharacterized repeat protein (TIGR02059 family)
VFICSYSSATKYYISNSGGSNSANGRSTSTAWKTISKVNGTSFLPGDTICFNKGDVWRETLMINNSGNSGAYIVYTSYGTGSKPQILGSIQAVSWTNQGNNVWKSATSVADPYSGSYKGEIYFTGLDGSIKWGHVKKSGTANLAQEYDWTWLSNYVYVYSPTDPASRYSAIEVSQDDLGIDLNDKEYIELSGFDIKYWRLAGVKGSYPAIHIHGLNVNNCEVGYIGTKESPAAFGLSIYYSDCLIKNNSIHDCGRRGVSINTDTGASTVIENVTAENNTFYNGFHTTGIDLGNTGSSTFNNIIIRNNIINDNPALIIDGVEETESVGMLIGNNTSGVHFTNIYIYNNIIKYTKLKGLDISGTTSLYIYNNVFYGVNPTLTSFGGMIYINSTSAGVNIKNNIFYNDVVNSVNNYLPCIYRQTGASVVADYNLYYMTNTNSAFVNMGGLYLMSQWSSYKSSTGFDAHSPTPSNPKFVSLTDYHLQVGSVGLRAGIAITEVKTDFDNVAYGTPPNLGCYATPLISGKPKYVSSKVENATPSILEITFDMNLANILPVVSAFLVLVNSVARPVSTVSISGTSVMLTLSSPIVYGDIVTVGYTKPGTNPIQISSGEQADTFTAQTVTNNVNQVAPVIPLYISSVIQNATPSILEMTYDQTLANIVPAASAFTVLVNSATRTVSSVAISGTKVLLTLFSPVVFGDIVTVAYTKPATNPLQTASGGQAVTITARSVTNNVNAVTTIPVYVSSAVQNAAPSILEMTYDQTLASILPSASAFTVMVNSAARTVSSLAVTGTKVLLTLTSPVVYGDIVTVAYTKPASNPLQTASGGLAATITAKSVTNNVNAVIPVIPVYVSSAVQNSTPSILEMTYDQTLASIIPATSAFTVLVNSVVRTVSSVAVSGTIVRLTLSSQVYSGDIIVVAYAKPASNQLQTASGGQAATLTAQSVTNNVTTVTPIIPVYISSAIQNATPSILEMTYDQTLASIIPAASSFAVLVNSVTRNVSSVAISGTIVRLTLSGPVVFGDIITVAYTQPASNPLQTVSAGRAASISAQPVTNNVIAVPPVIPVYISSAVQNTTPSILEMTYDQTLASIVPSASAFSVLVNSVTRTVSSVAVSGTKVQLTLSSPVVYGDIITIAYTQPASNPLQTVSGGLAATITAQTVTNNVNPVAPALPVYVSSVIQNATPSLLEMTYDQTLAGIVPAASAFRVRVNSVTRSISSVIVSGNKVLLTLSSPVVYGNVITVSYTKPSTNPLQTALGGQAASISSRTVTNNVNYVTPVIPVYVSSVIQNDTPSTLEMTYDQTLVNIVPSVSAFTVRVNSVRRTVSSVIVSGTTVLLTLSSPVVYGNVITVAYTRPSSNPLQTASGGQAATLSAATVTNNVNTGAPVIPVYVSSVIQNATPSLLEITYDQTLANIVPAASSFIVLVNSLSRTVSSVAVSGTTVLLTLSSPVVYGDIITIAYTKPSVNPLQTPSGGQAATISAPTVTNNVTPINPVYVSSVIQNATPSTLEMTYDHILANIVPAATSFTVLVNSVSRTINAVNIAGAIVQLTLASPVVFGDIVTITYTKPASNPLQTASGGQAANIIAQQVTNNVNAVIPVIPVYVSSVIQDATPSILEVTYDQTLVNIVPAVSAFTVLINSISAVVNAVTVAGTTVQLTLSIPVIYGDIVTIAYTKPASNPLQTASGGQAATIIAQQVINNVNAVIPVNPEYVSSVIQNAAPSILEMTYDQTLANIVPPVSAFIVLVNSVSRTINAVTVSGEKVQLALASPVAYGDIVTLAYTKPASNPLQTALGGQAATLSTQPVTNNVNAVTPVDPLYISSVIQNTAPSILEMTYDQVLANIVPAATSFTVLVNSVSRTINVVSVSGAKVKLTLAGAVKYGDIITVAYTKPAINPLQTASGGQAATITAQQVTNNVNYVVPVIPVYISSVIQNATPSILEITYTRTLANIVPDVSAYVVMVNSVPRTVTAVIVSLSKVQLTLGVAVVHGDIVTVAYTKPSSNPIQTPSGGQAATIGARSVTNNVNAVTPVNPVYVSSVIQNANPSLLEITYDQTLTNIVPSSSAFTVLVNSVSRTINTVTVSGAKVLLTLASPVIYGDIVTIAYTKPASNPLQTVSGGQAATLSTQSVSNNVNPVPVVNPQYVSSVIQNITPILLEVTYDQTLANIVPDVSAFTVLVNSFAAAISSLSVSGTKVMITLSFPVVYGDIVTVSYTKPSVNPLQSNSGGQAATISAQLVNNNVNQIFPVYISSVVEDTSPSLLEMTYDQALSNIVPVTAAFTVQVNSIPINVSSVAISGTSVLLTLSSPIVYGDIITVAYTKPASNPLQVATGGQAENISAQPVTNNVNSVIPIVPAYVSSVIESDAPSELEITFDQPLSNIVPIASAFRVRVNSLTRGVSSVVISGTTVILTLASPVVYGNVVTVAYTKQTNNPLQTPSGGQAETFSAQAVTNNVISVIPVYVSSDIENATPSLLEITYDLDLANIIPAISSFTVRVNSVIRTISSVAISGPKVLLTLSGPVVYGNVVTVAYSRPAGNRLQSVSGGQAATLSAQTVTNNVNPVIPYYVSSVIQNAAPAIVEMTYNLNLVNISPAGSAFSVMVNSVSRPVSIVAISGTKVFLTLESPVVYGDVVTVSYVVPDINPLQTVSGAWAETISAQTVSNNVDPVTPVDLSYVRSFIENSSPGLLEMVYNFNMANIVPDASAFTVMVNSISTTVNSVIIDGNEVLLTLASEVAAGDVVTVSYSKPVINPLQSITGGQAASISNQPVTNNIGTTEYPPVIVINYETNVYSGFINEIDASDSYDLNSNDHLSYEWIAPAGVPLSSASSSKVQFLAPITDIPDNVEFILNVSDEDTIVSKTISINILPFKPELEEAKVMSVEAIDFAAPDYPTNIADGKTETQWYSEGSDQWIFTKLFTPFKISHIQLTFPEGLLRAFYFDIYASADGITWDPVLSNAASCFFSGNPQVFEFPFFNTEIDYSFVKFVGHGNTTDLTNFISEFKVFGYSQGSSLPGKEIEFNLYPNPAHDYFNILLSEPVSGAITVRIQNMSGQIVYENLEGSDINLIYVPFNLGPGVYIVDLYSEGLIIGVMKLIVN